MPTTRRGFVAWTGLGAAGIAGAAWRQNGQPVRSGNARPALKPPAKPVIVTRDTGDNSVNEAYAMLLRGDDTLDAALHICQAREDDPHDHSVGLGGLPNEDGAVELDACVMHGPTRRAGSVGAVQNIRHAARLATTVMRETSHVMIVGGGAEKFAVAEGFPREDLLTDEARKMWLLWKEHGNGWWGPGIDSPEWKPPLTNGPRRAWWPRHPAPEHAPAVQAELQRLCAMGERMGMGPELRRRAALEVLWPTTGTIHVSVVNTKGEMSGATTTSGLAWKIPGRLGDSPIIGAGCYTDQDVGSAGATGNGEENIKVAGAHTIVELMREGMEPRDAGLETLRRIARDYNNDMAKLRYIDMIYYILRRDGAYAGVSLWSTRGSGVRKTFVVHDGTQRTEACASLFEGETLSIHPF